MLVYRSAVAAESLLVREACGRLSLMLRSLELLDEQFVVCPSQRTRRPVCGGEWLESLDLRWRSMSPLNKLPWLLQNALSPLVRLPLFSILWHPPVRIPLSFRFRGMSVEVSG